MEFIRHMETLISYTFRQKKVLISKTIYPGFSVLEKSKFLLYEVYYDILQPYFGLENLQLHYLDTDKFLLSVKTKDFFENLENLEDLFDFSNLNENYEKVSKKNKEVIGKVKIESPKNIWIDEFVCLRSKMYSFKCGGDTKNR